MCIHTVCYTLIITVSCTHKYTNKVPVRDKPVVKTRALPNCLFDRQLNRISRNNGALNLPSVPWRLPERGSGVRGRRFSLIYVGRQELWHDPVSNASVCQLVIEE